MLCAHHGYQNTHWKRIRSFSTSIWVYHKILASGYLIAFPKNESDYEVITEKSKSKWK